MMSLDETAIKHKTLPAFFNFQRVGVSLYPSFTNSKFVMNFLWQISHLMMWATHRALQSCEDQGDEVGMIFCLVEKQNYFDVRWADINL